MKLCIGMIGMHLLVGKDFAAVQDLVTMADDKGIEQLSVVEHVVMGENREAYPYGDFGGPAKTPFIDPIVQLASLALITKRIQLSSGIMIGPLRSAAMFAKQVASLDVLSRGRAVMGLGVGWQREEYVACGVDWDNRFALLEEQIRVCRKLWSGESVSHHSEFVSFDDVTARPKPVQGTQVPIWLGLALKPRNVARIAELCQGWIPMERDPAELRSAIDTLKRAFEAHGRDPETLEVRATYEIVRKADGSPDMAATLAQTRAYADAGVTMMRLEPVVFCRSAREFETYLDMALEIREATRKN